VTDSEQPRPGHDRIGSAAEEAAKLFGVLSGWASDLGHDVEDHLATGAAECTYCPICRTVHAFREAGPEIRAHLASASASLLQAAAGVLAAVAASQAPVRDRSTGVENIDLGEGPDEDWPETDQPEEKQ
jgi:hypothetical protein